LEIVYEDFEVNLTKLAETVMNKHEHQRKKGNVRWPELQLSQNGLVQFCSFLEVAFSIRNTTKYYDWLNMDWVFLTASGELKVMIPFFYTGFETDWPISLEQVISAVSPIARSCYSLDKGRRNGLAKTPNEAKQGNSQISNHNIFVCGFFLLFRILPGEQSLKAKYGGEPVDFFEAEAAHLLFHELKAAAAYIGNERLAELLFKLLVRRA
jgi:hypothetical protein